MGGVSVVNMCECVCVTVTGHDGGLWDAGNVPGLDQSAQIFTL